MNTPRVEQLAVLRALQFKIMYRGTVPHHVKLRRRAKSAVAKQSRKRNRP